MTSSLVDAPVFHASRNLAIEEGIINESFPENGKRVDLALIMMDFLIKSPNPHTCGISLGDIMECCYSFPPTGNEELHAEREHRYTNSQSWTYRDMEVFDQIIKLGIESEHKSLRVTSAVEALKQAKEVLPIRLPELRQKFAPVLKESGLW
ncbi:MAG: hypothetical protein WAV40_03725 [Microgenomates group bacterium]